MPPSRPLTTAVVLLAAAATLGLSACSQSPTAGLGPGAPSAAATPRPAPLLHITPSDGSGNVRIDAVVTVSAEGGVLDKVDLHSAVDPTPLSGNQSADRTSWSSTASLDPNTSYVVEASAHSPAGDGSTAHAAFTTMPTPKRLTTSPTPTDGSTVGVGMPIVLRFNAPVQPDRQAALLQHITVNATPATVGAWHWFGPDEVHWRPKDYWASGTKVTVNAALRGVDAGNNVWGLGDWSMSFTVGQKHVTVIDAAAHNMKVYADDQLVHTYPVSTGRPRNQTLSGTLVVWYKQYDVLMDSQTIGIPRNSPDGYYEHVYWDTAISTDGFFIHSAPWSEWAQGSQNVSHGCVNLSPARAQEFFQFSQVGDVVQVLNTSRKADASDGEGDWQIPFEQFDNTGGSATPPPTPAQPGGI